MLMDRCQWPARRLMIFGLHVHVGVENGEKAIAVFNSLSGTFHICWPYPRVRRSSTAGTLASQVVALRVLRASQLRVYRIAYSTGPSFNG